MAKDNKKKDEYPDRKKHEEAAEPKCTASYSMQMKCDVCVKRTICPLSQLSDLGRRMRY